MSVSNYIINKCKYKKNEFKPVLYTFQSNETKIIIDNGEAYIDGTNYTIQMLYSGDSITVSEATSYDDRYKFEKNITLTFNDAFSYISNDAYYYILEDEEKTLWVVNPEFMVHPKYKRVMEDDNARTEITLSINSNFPLLKLTNVDKNNLSPVCKEYKFDKVEKLKLLERKYADISGSTLIAYSNQTYKDVDFLLKSCNVTDEYDGNYITTTLQFQIPLSDYKSSWQYNLLEYQDNKYVAVINDRIAIGFGDGLVPSYSINDGVVAITLKQVSSTFNASYWNKQGFFLYL